jgi:hypothetical protein
MTKQKQSKISLKPEIVQIIREDASANGISMAAYVSMLVTQKRLETSAMRLINAMTMEELKNAVKSN